MAEVDTGLRNFINHLTSQAGVYRMIGSDGNVLYIGKAKNLQKRVSSYFNKNHNNRRIQSLVQQIQSIEVTVTQSETEALLLESNLIKSLRPKYNVLMRDDKTYPYLKVSSHAFPRMEMFRSKKKPSKGEFYGPYPSAHALKASLNTIQKLFKIRNCRDSFYNARSRPCLQYQINRCTAPCTHYVSAADYQQQLINARRFLQGKCQAIIQELEQKMAAAVAALAYEEAATVRDHIKQLRVTQEQQSITQLQGDADAIAIEARDGFACVQLISIRNGEVLNSQNFLPRIPGVSFETKASTRLWQAVFNAFIARYYFDEPNRIPAEIIVGCPVEDKAALTDILSQLRGKRCTLLTHPRSNKRQWLDMANANLQRSIRENLLSKKASDARFCALESLLQRNSPIQRMECFDISHTQGESTVASCVVFNRQGPCKNEYRQFNIENITPGDDYAAIKQAIERRFRRLQQDNNLPDVLIVDGGKGQRSSALEVFHKLGIDQVILIGIAKGVSRKVGWERLILSDTNAEIQLEPHSQALHLLQHIRDEAHRFAISRHRNKRQKTRNTSALEHIEGIGTRRRQALLQRFGGLQALKSAAPKEIAKVPGISFALAEKIYEYLHR